MMLPDSGCYSTGRKKRALRALGGRQEGRKRSSEGVGESRSRARLVPAERFSIVERVVGFDDERRHGGPPKDEDAIGFGVAIHEAAVAQRIRNVGGLIPGSVEREKSHGDELRRNSLRQRPTAVDERRIARVRPQDG